MRMLPGHSDVGGGRLDIEHKKCAAMSETRGLRRRKVNLPILLAEWNIDHDKVDNSGDAVRAGLFELLFVRHINQMQVYDKSRNIENRVKIETYYSNTHLFRGFRSHSTCAYITHGCCTQSRWSEQLPLLGFVLRAA